MTLVSKEVTFDCAHMLSGHNALCKNLHGHTYKMQVRLWSQKLIKTGSSTSMVIDFKDLKTIIQEEVIDHFDHAVIFSSEEFRDEAENDLYAWAVKYGKRYVELPSRSTAESMAELIQFNIQARVSSQLPNCNVHVRLYETPTSFAEV